MLQDADVKSDEENREGRYFSLCYQSLYLPFSVILQWPLLLLSPRNDVMYTHLMINMQP